MAKRRPNLLGILMSSRNTCTVFSVAHAFTSLATLRSLKYVVKKRCIYPFMSLLPQYREREDQVNTGEAGSMKKSELWFPIRFVQELKKKMYEQR